MYNHLYDENDTWFLAGQPSGFQTDTQWSQFVYRYHGRRNHGWTKRGDSTHGYYQVGYYGRSMGSNAYWSNGYGDEEQYDESPPNDDAMVRNARLEDMFRCLLEKSEAQEDLLHEMSFEIGSINDK